MTPNAEAKHKADDLIIALCALPDAGQIAGWIAYVMEGIEAEALSPDEAADLLRRVRDAIDQRLQGGVW